MLARPDVEVTVTTTEVQVNSVALKELTERARPIVAIGASAVKLCTDAAARSRQEYAVTVGAGNLVTVDAVIGSPSPSATAYKFFKLLLCGHSPTTAPLRAGCVVMGTTDIAAYVRIVTAVVVLVTAVGVVAFSSGFAPSVVVTIAFGRGGAYIPTRPANAKP